MITTIRLDSDLKNQINYLSSLYQPQKKFSDMMRFLLEKSVNELIKEESQKKRDFHKLDIRYVSQRYDFGESLTFDEIDWLFQLLDSIFYRSKDDFEHHPKTFESLINMFLSVIESGLIKNRADEIFRANSLIGTCLLEKPENQKIFDSFDQYLQRTATFLRLRLKKWQQNPFLEEERSDLSSWYILRSIGQIMHELTDINLDYISDRNEFLKLISPYLKMVITIVKTKIANKENVCHFLNDRVFRQQHNIDFAYQFLSTFQPNTEKAMNYRINFPYNGELSFSSNLSFEGKKDVSMTMNFQEFLDMLRFSSLLHGRIEKMTDVFQLRGTHLELLIFHSNQENNDPSIQGRILIRGIPIYFNQQDLIEMFTLFKQIETEIDPLIQNLKYQFGGL